MKRDSAVSLVAVQLSSAALHQLPCNRGRSLQDSLGLQPRLRQLHPQSLLLLARLSF